MNIASIVLLILIAVAFIMALRYMSKNKGGVCTGCSQHCRLDEKKQGCGKKEEFHKE